MNRPWLLRSGLMTLQTSDAHALAPMVRTGREQKVLVLGAGLSGLCAAYELSRAGHDVTILEGSLRIGGRVLTVREPFASGLHVEMGAGRIPPNHDLTLSYIRHFDLPVEPFMPSAPLTNLVRDQTFVANPTTDFSRYFAFSSDELALGPAGIIEKYLMAPVQEILAAGDATTEHWPPPSLRTFDRNIVDYLRHLGASRGAIDFLLMGNVPREISALMGYRALATTVRENMVKIAGGNDRLPQAFATKLGDKIVLAARIVAIEQDSQGVCAIFDRKGQRESIRGDAMICTLPFKILRDIDVRPTFSASKTRAIQAMHYSSAVKVAIQSRERSWEASQLSGFAQLDTGGEIWNPSWDRPKAPGLLQLYQQGEQARQLDQMTPAAQVHAAAATLRRVFPTFEPEIGRSLAFSWQSNEWSRGAFSILRPGDYYDWFSAVASAEHRVHFAGEHTSAYPAWMQGALTSGRRAAHEVNGVTPQ